MTMMDRSALDNSVSTHVSILDTPDVIAKSKIVIVDDNPINLKVIRAYPSRAVERKRISARS